LTLLLLSTLLVYERTLAFVGLDEGGEDLQSSHTSQRGNQWH
jgi:hypothetical protein